MFRSFPLLALKSGYEYFLISPGGKILKYAISGMKFHNKIDWFIFFETNIEALDIPDEPIEFYGQNSLSERLQHLI